MNLYLFLVLFLLPFTFSFTKKNKLINTLQIPFWNTNTNLAEGEICNKLYTLPQTLSLREDWISVRHNVIIKDVNDTIELGGFYRKIFAIQEYRFVDNDGNILAKIHQEICNRTRILD